MEEKKSAESLFEENAVKKVPRSQKPNPQRLYNLHKIYGLKTEKSTLKADSGREGAKTSLEVH